MNNNKLKIDHLALFEEQEFEEFQSKLTEVDITLETFNSENISYNAVEDYTFQYMVSIGVALLGKLWIDVQGNAKWDAIKYIAYAVWRKTREKTFIQRTTIEIEEKPVKMCVNFDNFKYSCEGLPKDLSPEKFNEQMEKAKELYAQYKSPDDMLPKPIKLIYFDDKKFEWVEYNRKQL
jgi:hypothetical protein